MQNKVSLFWEDALAAASLFLLVAFCLPVLSLEKVKPSPVAPAAAHAEPLLLPPLQCNAVVLQSGDGIEEPRARCYFFKGGQ